MPGNGGSGAGPVPASALWPRSSRMTVGARVGLLALVTGLALVVTRDIRVLGWIGLLAVAAGFGLALPRHRVVGPRSRFAEVIVVCFAVDSVAMADRPGQGVGAAEVFLPYLLAPVLSAAVYRRTRESLALLGAATGTLVGLAVAGGRSEEHTSELQSLRHLVCRLLLEKTKE